MSEIVKDSVALLMPCAGAVDPKVVQTALVLTSFANANGTQVRQVGVTERTLIHTARNVLAKGFLETDCEWSFWMDSDMILEPRTIPVMVQWAKRLNAKFLTGIYYQRMGNHMPVIFVRDEKVKKYEDEYAHSCVAPPKDSKKPFLVHRTGFGCVLLHRDVLAKLEEPYFKYPYVNEKKELSEDFYFCIKAQKAGVDLWAIPELDCGHVGTAPIIRAKDFVPGPDMIKTEVRTVN